MISFKKEVVKSDLEELSPATLLIFSALCLYARRRGFPIVVTSIKSDLVEGRVSTTHATYRAIDVSSKGWTKAHCKAVEEMLNINFKTIGAITKLGEIKACVWHDAGSGPHFHCQSRPLEEIKDYF